MPHLTTPRLIANYPCHTGENPLWHPDDKRLYWVDIPAGTIYAYDPQTSTSAIYYQGKATGGITRQADGSLLLFQEKGSIAQVRTVNGKGQLERYLIEEIPQERPTRFNDVIADPMGRVFCGTIYNGDHPGRLYRLDLDGSLHLILDNLTVSNGMGFTRDGLRFYHTDSERFTVKRYAYDATSGAISDEQVFLQFTDQDGYPDGLTVDSEDCVWVAFYNGASVIRFSPQGARLLKVDLPTARITCPTFGGDHYQDLYITSAGGNDRAHHDAIDGSLFQMVADVKGVPEFVSRITTVQLT